MKKLLGGIALSALLAAPAMAADLPARMPVKAPVAAVVSVYNWTGFYVGGHVGYGWGDSSFTSVGVVPATFTEHNVKGVLGGAQAGINWQRDRFVLGIEGSVSATGMDGSSVCPNPAFNCNTDIDHFWRVGARAGIALGQTGNWLIYGAGGFARAYVKTNFTAVAGGAVSGEDKVHHHGWYAGGGIDYGVTPNFIIGVEAYRVSLGDENHFLPGGVVVAGSTRNVDLDFTVVQARASYKFNWGGPVVARY